MLSRILFATIAVFAVVAAADHEFGVFDVTTVSPTNAHFRGRDLITIKGVGFRTFSQVACLWNHEWSSFDSRIVDDNTIVCETPVLNYSEITALPFTTTLNVVFDGDSSIKHLVTENFVFGPALVSFSPASGFVGGGEKFTVKGARFSDFKSAAIYFDGKACLSTIIRNDTDIICVVPAGSYDQDAMVTVVFDGQEKTYLHFENTYHFGPVITTIVPPCGNFQGGSRVSLLGNNFADPVLGSTVPPVGALPTVEVVFNSRRYFGLDVTFDGSQVIFTTPFIDDNTFGQDVDIYVHFKGINSKVTLAASTFKFRYGPIVYNTAFPTPYLVDPSSFKNPTPSSGHRAGGDIIAIDGCGFSNFTTAQISPILDVSPNPREFCIRGPNGAGGAQDTLIITSCGIGCERILCYSAPFDCEPADIANGLSVEFRAPSDRFQTSYVLPPAEEDTLSFKLGPVVTSIDKTRGRWTGGETVTVTGVNFFSNGLVSSAADPGWTVTAVFADANDVEDSVTVAVKVVSDTKMTFVTPQMPFNYNALLNFNFDSTCESLPRIPFAFTFGPSCSTLTPPNDILSGGRPVTISGLGFTEDGVSDLSNVEVRLCNLRLSDGSACDVFEVPQVTSVSNTAITFVTSSLRDGISTTVGGNRLFGDAFEVQVLFNGVGAVLEEEDAFGLLACDIFRFGPVTSAISPQKGPTGPRAANSPGTKVTITGTAFNDPVYNQNIRVAINSGSNGYIFNNAAKVDGFNDQTKDRRITFSTVWGGVANTDADVITVFNTCNTTVSDFTVNWGPVITSISGVDGAPINPIGNANLDVYGALPEGGQQIVVNGLGFNDFPGEDGELAIRCLIDGVQVSTSINDDGTQVTCTLPPRSFSTVVNVTLEFGYICGDSALPFNYLQSLTATQRVFYRPRIISISPDYGLTSGGQQVTFSGEGFNGWDTYICYFGQYSNLQVATVNDEGTTVTCSTPYHRAEFNTDVSAHILLSGVHPSRKVISPVTYHYGPVCSDVLPSVASIAGGGAANINGDGFIDCQDSGPNSPFLNCTFVDVQIAFNYTLNRNNSAVFANNTGLTSTTVGFFAPAAVDGCGERPVVSLYFPDAIVSDESRRYVQCTNDDEAIYHYGPLVSGYSSQYFRANTAYGWTDTQVTITGLSLADPSLGQPTCQFGNKTGTTVSVTDESVICSAPENKWDVVVEVSLNYGNSCKIQDTVAGLFHYGPVIDSISPDFGYVAGETPVTFSGFAFECCGITQYECMFPGNLTDNFSYPTTFAGNTVTCNVPANEKIDILFNNVGVRFGGSFFTGNDSYHTLTEDNDVLRYYYGPIVTGITPDRASLSGEGDAITILGAGFDDPYFDAEVVCDFFTKTNGFNGTTTASSVDFDSIVCPVPTFNHRCGDFDDIRPRWGRSLSLQQLRPEQGASYWKTALPARSAARPVLPFSSDGGSTRAQFYGPVIYGPKILSVQSVDGLVDPISESASAIRAPISGGVFVSVTFDDIQDWADAGSDNSFGSEFAWCLFGNRGSPALSAITPGSNTITCEIPSGAWNFKGQLSVILDPHADFGTTLTTDDDQYWHWLPFATNVNKNLAGPKGYESIVVTGAGFCQYNSVICTFGNTQGVQADIVNDYRVVCQSPPASPGLAPLTLTFCSGLDCSAVTDNALNTIPVLETFTIAGITNISPREGPRCGGTNLTISGAGFSLFERLTCRFNQGRFESAATLLSDGSAYCITPDTTSEAVSNPVSCVDVALVGRFKDTADIVFESPVTFEIGTPIVFASDPTSAWIEVKTEVVVIGEYFNGDALNIQEGKYKCVFGDLDPIPAEFYYFTEDDNELKTAIVCDTPTIFSEPDLKTGTVDLEIIFACNDAKATVNKLPFTFFQKPDIDDFTPKEGAEVGGTQVVVTGEHLAGGSGYFCSFGTFGIDNQVVSAVWDPIEATITCVSPSNVVSTNVLVDFAISVDGGKTFVRAEEPYQYEDVTRVCGNNDAPGDNPNVPLVPINSSSVLAPSFLLALLAVAFSRLFLF